MTASEAAATPDRVIAAISTAIASKPRASAACASANAVHGWSADQESSGDPGESASGSAVADTVIAGSGAAASGVAETTCGTLGASGTVAPGTIAAGTTGAVRPGAGSPGEMPLRPGSRAVRFGFTLLIVVLFREMAQ